MRDGIDPLHAIVDIHKAAGLRAVAPDVDRVISMIHRGDYFAADCRRSFLPPAIPGAPRPVDVMKPGDEGFQTALGPIFLAKDFGDELFPAVTALWHGGVGI